MILKGLVAVFSDCDSSIRPGEENGVLKKSTHRTKPIEFHYFSLDRDLSTAVFSSSFHFFFYILGWVFCV